MSNHFTQANCYQVQLPTTNGAQSTAEVSVKKANGITDEYLKVESGVLYIIAKDLEAAGKIFPNATSIVRMGIGYIKTSTGGTNEQEEG